MSLLQIVVIAAAFVVAGVAKGAIGMGMPPIAIGLMSFAVPLESAIAIMVRADHGHQHLAGDLWRRLPAC